MRLKSIKLAGFKSFVDPTTLPLRNNLIGVVGPNGCGKSNIVDALRWVLGESSARQLRGGALADVIFSGSTGRQPVGQATVELVFDNSDGGLAGNYGQYAEISVRRQASRDGQSVYFLNGTRCRRRDVTDLFLGTGLGPRSYAIIEQGMITRLIEARPEELRNFIEEAAGISKYKERRRETETRIRHTRENMERVADLQLELEKRLVTLKRQAQTAERYSQLKAEQRSLTGKLFTLNFATLSAQRAQQKQKLELAETQLEAERAGLTAQQHSLEQLREQQSQAHVEMARVQEHYYEAGAQIARYEQALTSARESLQRLHQELGRLEQQQAEVQGHIDEDGQRCGVINQKLTDLAPQLEKTRLQVEQSQRQLENAQHKHRQLTETRAQLVRDKQDTERRVDQESRRLRTNEERLRRDAASMQRLESRLAELSIANFGNSITKLNADIGASDQQLATLAAALANLQRGKLERVEKQKALLGELDQQRTRLQVLRGQQASLQALQDSAESGGGDQQAWLQLQGLADAAKVLDRIQVESGWEIAVERYLGDKLMARLLPNLDQIGQIQSNQIQTNQIEIDQVPGVTLVEAGQLGQFEIAGGAETTPIERDGRVSALGNKVKTDIGLAHLFAGAFTAESFELGLACRHQLEPGQLLVDPAGVLIGANWVEFPGGATDESLLQRGYRQTELVSEIARQDQVIELTRSALEEAEHQHDASAEELQRLQTEHQQLAAVKIGLQADLGSQKGQQERNQADRLRVAAELDHLQTQQQQESEDVELTAETIKTAQADLQRFGVELEPLELQRKQAEMVVAEAKTLFSNHSDGLRQLELQDQRCRLELEQLQRGDRRWAEQLVGVNSRLAEIKAQIDSGGEPIAEHEERLQQGLVEREQVTEALQRAREQVESVDQQLRAADQACQTSQLKIQQSGQQLEAIRLKEQELRVRETTLNEQASKEGFDLLTLLPEMEDDWDKQQLEADLQRSEKRISQLGPINLAAIDEHRQVAERKGYLDDQQADLDAALETMAAAIARIDRETRGRFRATFDKVNGALQSLFPQLFGGGNANLELVGDDLLSAGVSITAQPPGKRNSSIQLLSGGEKALTAIAMVFAIFQLNPAPFCVLDEVDAPLDDANVDRFCAMVRKMSDQVQFIFVTHNKATMELAQQLSGVTMGEPGVSRLVSVDLEAAAEMVGA